MLCFLAGREFIGFGVVIRHGVVQKRIGAVQVEACYEADDPFVIAHPKRLPTQIILNAPVERGWNNHLF